MNAPPATVASRFMLWIDGVGGYLVCEQASVAIGQPTALGRSAGELSESEVAEAVVDVPIMADISRRHALIERRGEHYLLRPLRRAFLDGTPVEHPRRLGDGAVVELGEQLGCGVRLAWYLPNVCGLTARLNVESRHRLQPHADGVVLLADSCLIGPARDDHIRVPRWSRTLVLHRRNDGELVFRADGSYEVDGRRRTGTSPISRSSQLRADDFSLHLEPLDRM